MKLLVIFISLVLWGFTSNAQVQNTKDQKANQCFKKDEIDEFLKIRKAKTEHQTVINLKNKKGLIKGIIASYNFYFEVINNKLYLGVYYLGEKYTTVCFSENASIMVKLSNDSILDLKCTERFECSSRYFPVTAYSPAEKFNVRFELSKKDLESIIQYDIVKFRIYTTSSYLEETINEYVELNDTYPSNNGYSCNPREWIKNKAKCVYESLN